MALLLRFRILVFDPLRRVKVDTDIEKEGRILYIRFFLVALAGPIASMLPAILMGMPLSFFPALNWCVESPFNAYAGISFFLGGAMQLLPIEGFDGSKVLGSLFYIIFPPKTPPE